MSASAPVNLTKRRLLKLECVIATALHTWVEMAKALTEIRDAGLYREAGFSRFEDYCNQRWGFNRAYANRLIAGAAVAENVDPIGSKLNEAQARELGKLEEPAQQREAWQKATDVSTPVAPQSTPEQEPSTTAFCEEPPRTRARRIRESHSELLELAKMHADVELEDADPWESPRIVEELRVDLRSVVDVFLTKIRAVKRTPSFAQAFGKKRVPQAKLKLACDWLHIPVPTQTRPLDYGALRKSYRKLLATYHPDKNPDNPRMLEMYYAIREAMDVIEQWRSEQIVGAR